MSAAAPKSLLSQARNVDDLLADLMEIGERELGEENKLKKSQEEVKKVKASLEKIRLEKNEIINDLTGKRTFPLFAEIKRLEKLEEGEKKTEKQAESVEAATNTEQLEQTTEQPAEEPSQQTKPEIKLERIGEHAKFINGEQTTEMPLEELEYRYVGKDQEEYATYDDVCNAGWEAVQKLSQDELIVLWNELVPDTVLEAETIEVSQTNETNEVSQDVSNVVSFLKPETEQQQESPDPLLETNLLNEPPVNLVKKHFDVDLTSDERIVIAQGSTSLTFPASKTDRILAYYGVKSVSKLTQDNLSEIFYEQVDYSKPREENLIVDNEEWPESIHALPKPDGSLILKYGTRMRKVNAVDVPTNLDTTSQDQLNALWLYDKAYDYNPEHDKTDITSLSGKKQTTRKKKSAEATV